MILICISLMTNDVEHLFVSLFVCVCLYHSANIHVLWIQVPGFVILSRVLWIFSSNLPAGGLLLIFLVKCKTLMKSRITLTKYRLSIVSFFIFLDCKKSLPILSFENFLYFSISFIVVAFTFRSVLHFKLIFVFVLWDREEASCFSKWISIQSFQHYLSERLYFLHWICHLQWKPINQLMCRFIFCL